MTESVENLPHIFYSQILPLVVASQGADLQAQENMLKTMMLVNKRWKVWVQGSTAWIRRLLRVLKNIVDEAQEELELALVQRKRQDDSSQMPSRKRPYLITLDDLLENPLYALKPQVEKRTRLML